MVRPFNRHGIKAPQHKAIRGQEVLDASRAHDLSLADKNATIVALLDAVDGPDTFAPALRAARLNAQTSQPVFEALHDVVADDVDGYALDTGTTLGPVCNSTEVKEQSRALAQAYLAYLNPANHGDRSNVITHMLRLYQALTPALGSAALAEPDAPTPAQIAANAQEAIHRICMNVGYQLTAELAEQRQPKVRER